jgi:DNA end-binding protein Ku
LSNIGKALSGTVDVVQFVDQSEIDPIYFKKSYYLAPERGGVKAYKILLSALQSENKVGVAKVAIREREYVSTLRAEDDVLVLETMWWPDEVREPAFETLQEEVEPSEDEIKMAAMIIDNLTATFDPLMWSDASREAVEAMAQAKVEGQEIVAPESPEPTKVVDLLEALKASVEATKAKKQAV